LPLKLCKFSRVLKRQTPFLLAPHFAFEKCKSVGVDGRTNRSSAFFIEIGSVTLAVLNVNMGINQVKTRTPYASLYIALAVLIQTLAEVY
jgi:hypothetical protein